ncbi:Uncharacterized protein SCG7086_AA_00210 [Chlamydiales bacterium SCGC AG-110-P3]|nr:Uncharacterized protein SCG7086_AA_00210 [Chlamydiales bacterium SCGC AG-110-P3]
MSIDNSSFDIQSIPRVLRYIIGATLIGTIGSALLELLFRNLFGIPGPQTLFELSWYGMSHLWIWQPITHVFVHGYPGAGISFNMLIELLFHTYMLYALGGAVLDRVGERPFLRLYGTCAVAAGLMALLAMATSGQASILGGSTPPMLGILFLWTMLYPTAQLLLFFVLPVKAKWLAGGILIAITLVDLSQGDIVGWVWSISGIIAAYLYGTLAWGLTSPFPETQRIDKQLALLGERCRGNWRQSHNESDNAKIFDIKTGRPVVSDDAFIDAMLEKISREGAKSLSWSERWRMRRISKKKRL